MFADSIGNKFRLNFTVSLIRLLLVGVFILFFLWQQIEISLTAGLLLLPWMLAAFVQFLILVLFLKSKKRDFIVQSASASQLAIDIAAFIPFCIGIELLGGHNVIAYLYFPMMYGILLYHVLFPVILGWAITLLYIFVYLFGEPIGISVVPTPLLLLYGLAGTVATFISEGIKFERSEFFKTKQLVIAQEKRFDELKRSDQAHEYLLHGAKEKLETVDEVKSDFITLLAHELRTPIAAVRWVLESLGQGGGEAKSLAEKGTQSIDRVNLIIDRINSAGVAAPYVFKKEPLDTLVQEIVKSFEAEALRKKITLEQKYPETNTTVSMDADRLRIAIEEVVANAVTFTPEGGTVRVSIDDSEANTSRSALIIKIVDNGIGIPTEEKERIFEKFYRGDRAVKTETDGTGLGLYMAREIVNKHAGVIWFEDNPTGGTIFNIRIPLKQ